MGRRVCSCLLHPRKCKSMGTCVGVLHEPAGVGDLISFDIMFAYTAPAWEIQ